MSAARRFVGRAVLWLTVFTLVVTFGPVKVILVVAAHSLVKDLVDMASASASYHVKVHHQVPVTLVLNSPYAKHRAFLKTLLAGAVLFVGLGVVDQSTWSAAWESSCTMVTVLLVGPTLAAAVRSHIEVRRTRGGITR